MKVKFRPAVAAIAIFASCVAANALAAEIEEIVVTARAEEKSVREIPVAITAVTEERMNRFGLDSFTDLEALTPQLVVARGGSGNGAAIGIRGIASATSSIGIESSVSIIIDGVYMPQARAINEGLMDVRQVAVLKGPQALYFGKNATAGVVSLLSNNPGDEFEASLRVNNEFETDDLTFEGMVSIPINEKIGIRLAAQTSEMDKGWIKNNGGADTYTVTDVATFQQTTFDNPASELWFPKEEWTNIRLTVAGDLSDRFSYNFKMSSSNFEQSHSNGGGELFDCPTLNGVGHRAIPVDPQPAGRQTTLFFPQPQPAVDCTFNGARGVNDVPPGVAASNNLLAQFGDGSLGEEYESENYTLTLDYALDNIDLQTIINYHDAELGWVSDFDGGGVTSIFAGEFNTLEQFAVEARAITKFDSPVNFVLGVYYQETERYFNQDVIFAFIRNTGPIDDPNDEFPAYNKESETDGETWSVYGEVTWEISDRL
ncbi:MAG: TonB-dependent receptor, partial [Gammaproteobacteria bacterium]|nr:TonB-dependent receptor [Gammaproteobacteria bacterium]